MAWVGGDETVTYGSLCRMRFFRALSVQLATAAAVLSVVAAMLPVEGLQRSGAGVAALALAAYAAMGLRTLEPTMRWLLAAALVTFGAAAALGPMYRVMLALATAYWFDRPELCPGCEPVPRVFFISLQWSMAAISVVCALLFLSTTTLPGPRPGTATVVGVVGAAVAAPVVVLALTTGPNGPHGWAGRVWQAVPALVSAAVALAAAALAARRRAGIATLGLVLLALPALFAAVLAAGHVPPAGPDPRHRADTSPTSDLNTITPVFYHYLVPPLAIATALSAVQLAALVLVTVGLTSRRSATGEGDGRIDSLG